MEDMDIRQMTKANTPDPALLDGESPFRNQMLVAMPQLQGDGFAQSVIYICAHSASGAMGIVVNRQMHEISFDDLLEQLSLPKSEVKINPIVHFGGPVETGRGLVLHSTDFLRPDTVRLADDIGITGTVEILRAIADGHGPGRSIFALGYAGWGPGQLEEEMRANAWLTVPADDDLLFGNDLSRKWKRALHKIGISPENLSNEMGRA